MRSTSTLRRRLLNRDARVAVVGQGYGSALSDGFLQLWGLPKAS